MLTIISNMLISYGTAIFLSAVAIYYLVKRYIEDKIIYGMEMLMNNCDVHEGRDIVFRTPKRDLFLDVYRRGSLALGESYMAGNWYCPGGTYSLYHLFRKMLASEDHKKYIQGNSFVRKIVSSVISHQTSGLDMINQHYNLSNKFFESWLDKNMQYSCAYWNTPNMTLDQAQIAKMDLIGRKLKLQPGMVVLDIGCGWGMLAQHLASKFRVTVIGINLSTEHLKYANEKLRITNLPVRYVYGDFATISDQNIKFDRIVSVGFYEHVGTDRYDEFYRVMYDNLKDDGIALLHTIGSRHGNKSFDPWILKYIFTRGQIPNLVNITEHAENNDFVVEDVHNFGIFYGHTLLSWLDRFQTCNDEMKRNIQFKRMWEYYLAVCAASFHTRNLFLWQIIFTKKRNLTVYTGER